MTTPLVRQLRKAWPQARIDYLVGASSRAALTDNPHLDEVFTFDETILYRGQPARLGEVLARLKGYDTLFVMDKHWIFSVLARASGVPVRIGFRRRRLEGLGLTHRVSYGPLRHEIDYYLDLAEAAGAAVAREDVALEFNGSTPFELVPRTIVLVNSGGANAYEDSQVRRMPDALFAELVHACSREATVVFAGSASESAYYAQFASPACVNLCGRTSLPEAAALLRQAARVITTDTGLMHLAAAVNRNVTAVFGPTHPQRKCPPRARWVWADAHRYDAAYEVRGRVPVGRFFQSLSAQDVLRHGHPSPLDRA